MNKKLALVLIAIIGVGLYALPSTVSLFSGQHSFENIDATGNQIDCVKCHGDVNVELASGLGGTNAPHADFACELCHRVEAGKASGDNAYSAITYTATSVDDANLTVRKTLIVTDGDAEARNVPATIVAGATTISGNGISGAPLMGKYKVSGCFKQLKASASAPSLPPEVPCTANERNQTLTGPLPETFQTTSLYNSDGTPKDPAESTRYGTFDASKITFVWGCSQSSRSPYDWTCGQVVSGVLTDKVTPIYGFNSSGSQVSNPGTKYHAASLVSCLECHGLEAPTGHHDAEYADCNACHYAGGANKGALGMIAATGFGLGLRAWDDGALEAHTELVGTDDLITRQRDGASNGACVACHTHVAVNIHYMKPSVYRFDANFFSDGTEGVGGFSAEVPVESCSDGSAPPCV